MALIHYWSLNNLDTSSIASIDRAGSNNLTLNTSISANPTTGVAGFLGQGYLFTAASSQYCNSSTYIGPQSAMSMSVWVKPNTLPGPPVNSIIIAGQRQDGAPNLYNDLAADNNGVVFARMYQHDNFLNFIGRQTNTGVYSTAGWQHLVVTWSGAIANSAIKIFKNTVQVDTTDAGAGSPTQVSTVAVSMGLGSDGDGLSTVYVDGTCDELRQYDHALTSSEILELFSNGLQYFQPFSEPRRLPQTTVKSDHFTYDWKWLPPGGVITDLRRYWYQPLSEPIRIKAALPAPEQHFFSIDYKWINPILDLRDYWYQPLSEPRTPPDRRNVLPVPEQHFFSIDYNWINPIRDLRNYWYVALSEPRTPPDRRNVFPSPEQQFFSIDFKWINPITDLSLWPAPPLSEPVRFRAFPTPEQHFFSIDYKWITPTNDLRNYWYTPLTEPVRLKPGLPAPEHHFFSIDFKWIAPPGDLSAFYWYRPLEEPVRYRPLPIPTAEQQYFTLDYKWLNPVTDLRNYWYEPLTEPVRLKPGLPTPEQLAFTIDFQWVAPVGDLGKYYWFRPLEDPVRYRTFPAQYHQDFIMDAKWLFTGAPIITDLRNFWFVQLNEPVRLKPGLPTAEQVPFVIDWKWVTPTIDLQNYWYQPLGEPVRFRVFPTPEQQYFTVDYKWSNPVTDLRTWEPGPLSEPTRYRPSPFLSPYQQPFTTDTNTPLFFPNWYEPLTEPVRLKPGLPAPEQQFFSIDYKWVNPITDLSLWPAPPLSEPVRLKVGLATQHQIAFAMDWQWVAPIQVNVSYSLSASELFDKLAVRYTAADIVAGANVDITEIGNKPSANVAISEIETGTPR